jgi:hypothetical protein
MPYGVDGSGNFIGQLDSQAKYERDCIDCPGGFFCVVATITPVQCGLGKYSEIGQYTCLDCEPGYDIFSIIYSSHAHARTLTDMHAR